MSTHKQKLNIARRLVGGRLTAWDEEEQKNVRIGPFNNPRWNERKEAIAAWVTRKQGRAHQRAMERKDKKMS